MKDFITNHRKAFVIICVVVGLIIVGIIGISVITSSMGAPVDKNSTDYISITIESGSGTEAIGQVLYDNGLIKSVTGFKIISRLKGYDGEFKAGVYSLSPSMSAPEIADIIIGGKIETNSFTIPEGYTIKQTAGTLADAGLVDYDSFLSLLQTGDFDYEFLKEAQTGENHLEGYLFPNTYQIAKDATEENIVNVMLEQFNTVFKDEYYTRAKELGLSINEVITIASIIERECLHDADRAKVASVIYNRLDDGMALQMCSTVQYVLGKQKETLLDSDTKIESPYNTYINPGLPPGPIASPGEASIKAALYPEDTDYLYFVVSAKMDGSHAFSSNYNQFLKDKDAYYAALEN